jgi:hypothetical protein
MADQKLSDLTSLTGAAAASGDLFYIVDISESAANKSKKIAVSEIKTAVGLGNVENTALSTWAGSSSITTVGTVATGTISGGTY